RAVKQIGKEFECALQLLIQNLDVEGRRLAGRERVHFATQTVNLTRDLGGGARTRSLEEHVFDEVRIAGLRGVLVAGSGVDPDPGRDRFERRDPLGHHPYPVVENQLAVQCATRRTGPSYQLRSEPAWCPCD